MAKSAYRYVALGDSFTEGVGDDDLARPNGVRGWADRVAEELGRTHDVEYSNLAIRGWLLDQIVDTQLDRAIELKPDLITISAGGNDMLRPGFDVDAVIARYDALLSRLATTGAQIVVFTMVDGSSFPVFRHLGGRALPFNAAIREMVRRHNGTLADFFAFDGFDDPRMWSWDRLHLNTAGHTLMAANVLDVLGVEHSAPRPALGPQPSSSLVSRRINDAVWTRKFLLPWIGRRLRGTSSGDGLTPRYPEYVRSGDLV
ncbi:SGNH/GDSL hydrolase family protein [Gordonia sp. CPCC 205333]|uniref:SGNH/GDSL hydrolase family protein n=1 Tax=Gordonia sp. CPCC 205333 TaxID=3140790 RepID=UPI003AF33FF4